MIWMILMTLDLSLQGKAVPAQRSDSLMIE